MDFFFGFCQKNDDNIEKEQTSSTPTPTPTKQKPEEEEEEEEQPIQSQPEEEEEPSDDAAVGGLENTLSAMQGMFASHSPRFTSISSRLFAQNCSKKT